MGNIRAKNPPPVIPNSPSVKNLNIETFVLVWLDPNVDATEENRETQDSLREILTSLVTFDNIDQCETWLKKCVNDEKIILIVSGKFGEQIVPKIHYLPSIIAIYVYCLDVQRNKPWTKAYPKTRDVISSTSELLKELSNYQINLENIEDSKALEVYSLDTDTASYIWYELLLEILLSSDYLPMKSTSKELGKILRTYSSNDEYGLELIDEIERKYCSNNAVFRLVDDSHFERFVNKVLRERDTANLFLLRFLLVDIHQQLLQHQTYSLDAYRIQPMTHSQMETLLANPGDLIVNNGFVFASTDKSRLLSTINIDQQFETVLIHIKAKYRPGVAPFAFLRDIDLNIKERIDREVLFMCGSIFQVGSLACQDSIWTLEYTLMSDQDIPELFTMKQQLKQTHNFCQIGDLMKHCGQSEQTVIFYEQILNELPQEHPMRPQIKKQLSIFSKSHLSNFNSSFHLDIPANTRYVLVDLSLHMNDSACAMLGVLNSLTSDTIYVCKDVMPTDVFDQSMLILTTENFAKSLKNSSSSLRILTLENAGSKLENLIIQLADEIIRDYRSEAHSHYKANEDKQAKQLEDKANKIYQKMRSFLKKRTDPILSQQFTNPIDYSLVVLTLTNEDLHTIKQDFQDFFSSYYFFSNEHPCHEHIVEHEISAEIFLIILSDYPWTILEKFNQFSNVKHIYCLGQSSEKGERLFSNRRALEYKLTSDLLGYYVDLGDRYELIEQKQLARDIFRKGQRLSQFLCEHFILKK